MLSPLSRVYFRSIWCPKSNSAIRFPVSLLVLWTLAEMFPKLHILKSHQQTHSSTVRTFFKSIVKPIWCAEWNGAIDFTVSQLVLGTRAKTFRKSHILKSHPWTPSSTVRTSFKRVSRPIWCAESIGTIHFTVSLPVLPSFPKTFQKSQILNHHPQTPWTTVRTSFKRYIDLFDALNWMIPSTLLYLHWFSRCKQKRSQYRKF